MAERRMMSKTIVFSDDFLDMSLSARCLYFTFIAVADDDGFINNPKSIIRQCGAATDDLRLLITKNYVIPFDSGVIVIKHWKLHNYIQSDRYKPTLCQEEKNMLITQKDKSYALADKEALKALENEQCIHSVSKVDTQVRLGKDSIGKDSIGKDSKEKKHPLTPSEGECVNLPCSFTPPTIEEVKAYCEERQYNMNPEEFFDYYQSNGWIVGKNKMADWEAAVRSWERNKSEKNSQKSETNENLDDRFEKWAKDSSVIRLTG